MNVRKQKTLRKMQHLMHKNHGSNPAAAKVASRPRPSDSRQHGADHPLIYQSCLEVNPSLGPTLRELACIIYRTRRARPLPPPPADRMP